MLWVVFGFSGWIFRLFSGCFCDLSKFVKFAKTVYAMSNDTVIYTSKNARRFSEFSDSMCVLDFRSVLVIQVQFFFI